MRFGMRDSFVPVTRAGLTRRIEVSNVNHAAIAQGGIQELSFSEIDAITAAGDLSDNVTAGVAAGAFIGLLVAGPKGSVVGAVIGAAAGAAATVIDNATED